MIAFDGICSVFYDSAQVPVGSKPRKPNSIMLKRIAREGMNELREN